MFDDFNIDELSPMDMSFPINYFINGVKEKIKQAEIVAEDIYKSVVSEASVVAQLKQANEKGFRLVVDATESTLEAIDSGKIKLTTEKSGQTFAQIRKKNGQYGSKLPIKREDFAKGIDPVQMANSLQMMAMQKQMDVIADQLCSIDNGVQNILQGQQNDRIGLYYSGVSLFLEATMISDAEIKKNLVAQALKSLSDSTFQLKLMMESDIKYLANKEYDLVKGKRRQDLIDEKMANIKRSYAIIHQASMLKAGIYCEMSEIPAMSMVLNEYSHFLEGTVSSNTSLLAQCDKFDDGTETGFWKSKASQNLDVSEFVKQLKKPEKVIYVGISMEDE